MNNKLQDLNPCIANDHFRSNIFNVRSLRTKSIFDPVIRRRSLFWYKYQYCISWPIRTVQSAIKRSRNDAVVSLIFSTGCRHMKKIRPNMSAVWFHNEFDARQQQLFWQAVMSKFRRWYNSVFCCVIAMYAYNGPLFATFMLFLNICPYIECFVFSVVSINHHFHHITNGYIITIWIMTSILHSGMV